MNYWRQALCQRVDCVTCCNHPTGSPREQRRPGLYGPPHGTHGDQLPLLLLPLLILLWAPCWGTTFFRGSTVDIIYGLEAKVANSHARTCPKHSISSSYEQTMPSEHTTTTTPLPQTLDVEFLRCRKTLIRNTVSRGP